jgi:hypothetical protein
MEFVGHARDVDGCQTQIYLARIPSLAQWRLLLEDALWREVVEEPNAGFALFIAGDWNESLNEIGQFARYCIDHGVFWVSTWGPACEAGHDLFVWVEDHDPADSTVLTTSHADEPLPIATTLFFSAFPDEGKAAGPARIALSFGEPDWTEAMRRAARHEVDRDRH